MDIKDIETYIRVGRELYELGDAIADKLGSEIFGQLNSVSCNSLEIETGGVRFDLIIGNDVEIWQRANVTFDILFGENTAQVVVDNMKEQMRAQKEEAALRKKLDVERQERVLLARLKLKYEGQ